MAVNPITLSSAIKAALDEAFGPGFTTERQAVADAIGEAVAAAHNADAPGGTGINFADGETPAGSIDGSNAVFTLAHAPSPATSLHLFLNGIRLRPGTDYTLSGATITYAAGMIPQAGDRHDADYRY
jgi:hypothetical protein